MVAAAPLGAASSCGDGAEFGAGARLVGRRRIYGLGGNPARGVRLARRAARRHVLDGALWIELRCLARGDQSTESHDREAVRGGEDVVQVVRDHEHGEALIGQSPHEREHLLRLRDAEGGRRLVEDHQLGVPHHRLGDGDRLALTPGEERLLRSCPRDCLSEKLVRGQIATLVGGLVAVLISVAIARIYRINTTIMLVLGGIISGALFSSLLSLVKYLADPYNQLPTIVNWMMGSLTLSDRATVIRASIPICIGIAVLLLCSRHLNVLSMGDEEARALGVNVNRVRLIVILCATVVSALTVVIAGTISWVGLIVPHFTRMITGPDNRKLIPATVLIGAAYLIVVDDISRLAFSFEIPIGIVTALVGIPCFAFVLRNARKGWS